MTRTTMQEQKDLQVFPAESMLLLKVLEATIRTVPGKDGRDDWEKCSFKFKILQVLYCGDGGPVERFDPMVGEEIYGSVSWWLTNNAENRLRIWAEALLQVEMGLGFELDTNMFPGRNVKGMTSTYTNNQGRVRHQIETLLPAGQGMGSPIQDGWGQQQPGWGGQPQQQPPQQWQQLPQQQAPAAQNGQNGWATPGVQQQQLQQPLQPPQAQPQGTPQQWAPQENLQQQQYAQQVPPQVQPQPPQAVPPQAQPQSQTQYAQQQYQQYQQPPVQEPPSNDPWAPAKDPNEPDF